MTSIPPHRVALARAFMAGLLLSLGRIAMAECEVVSLTTWIVLQRGAGRN